MPPNVLTQASTAAFTCQKLPTSQGIASARAPISPASSAMALSLRETSATFAPASAKARAAAAPIPRLAPVIRTVLPLMSM